MDAPQLTRFGNYEVLRRIAVGGMGEIFLARQTGIKGFERLAIIKTLLSSGQDDDERVEAFLGEARIAALLNHPCIVQIYDLGDEQGTYYIAMEYVEGDTVGALAAASLRQARHNPWAFVALMSQAARALHFAHHHVDNQGEPLHLVHRDISPQNLMVRRDGTIKVVNFGIAKVANSGGARTATGVIKGKIAYMSPEQVQAFPVNARSDLFSLGIVTWELTTARRLFANLPEHAVAHRIVMNQIPCPSEQVPDYPKALEAVVMRAISPDPKDRFQTGEELADALDALLASVPDAKKENLPRYVESLIGARVQERTAQAISNPGVRSPEMPTPARSRASAPTSPTRTGSRIWFIGGAAALVLGVGGALVATRLAVPTAEPLEDNRPVVTAPEPAPQPTPVEPPPPEVPEPAARPVTTPRTPEKRPESRPRPDRPTVTPVAAPAAAEDGHLSISATPWATVTVDGENVGTTPLYKLKLTAGKHKVVLHNEAEGLTKTLDVVIPPGGQERLKINLK